MNDWVTRFIEYPPSHWWCKEESPTCLMTVWQWHLFQSHLHRVSQHPNSLVLSCSVMPRSCNMLGPSVCYYSYIVRILTPYSPIEHHSVVVHILSNLTFLTMWVSTRCHILTIGKGHEDQSTFHTYNNWVQIQIANQLTLIVFLVQCATSMTSVPTPVLISKHEMSSLLQLPSNTFPYCLIPSI